MDKVKFNQGYLAPTLKIYSTASYRVFCGSVHIDVEENPFEENTEENW